MYLILIGLRLIDLLIGRLIVPQIDPRMIDVIDQLMDLLRVDLIGLLILMLDDIDYCCCF